MGSLPHDIYQQGRGVLQGGDEEAGAGAVEVEDEWDEEWVASSSPAGELLPHAPAKCLTLETSAHIPSSAWSFHNLCVRACARKREREREADGQDIVLTCS